MRHYPSQLPFIYFLNGVKLTTNQYPKDLFVYIHSSLLTDLKLDKHNIQLIKIYWLAQNTQDEWETCFED